MEFISINDALLMIARQISITDDDLEKVLNLAAIPETSTVLGLSTRTFGVFGKAGYLETFRSIYQRSEAAAQLDKVLNDAEYVGPKIHWYDHRSTGIAKINPHAPQQFLPLLEDLSAWGYRSLEGHRRGEIPLNGRGSTPIYCKWEQLSDDWKEGVGFDVQELIALLDAFRLPHSLVMSHVGEALAPPPTAANTDSKVPESASTAQIEHIPAKTIWQPRPLEVPPLTFAEFRDRLFRLASTQFPAELADDKDRRQHIVAAMLAEIEKACTTEPPLAFLCSYANGRAGVFLKRVGSASHWVEFKRNTLVRWVYDQFPKKKKSQGTSPKARRKTKPAKVRTTRHESETA